MIDDQDQINVGANSDQVKKFKGAMILLKETDGGIDILVTFLDENDKPMGSAFDKSNFVHAIANAAPVIIGEIANEFKIAVECN